MIRIRRSSEHFPGTILAALWVVFWAASFYKFRLVLANYFTIPAWKSLGLDFLHNHLAVRFWLSGGNPYVNTFGDPRGLYAYPPIVLLLYSWCGLFSLKAATLIWTTAVAGTLIWATVVALKAKTSSERLLPIALVLWSTPALFAMERGNGDALILAGIVVASILFEMPAGLWTDLGIGGLFAIASWVKIYPLVMVFSLLPLRRWRSFAFSIAALLAVGFLSRSSLGDWLVAMMQSQGARVGIVGATLDWLTGRAPSDGNPANIFPPLEYVSHSLSSSWPLFMGPLFGEKAWLTRMPGLVAATLIFGTSLVIVGLQLFKVKNIGLDLVLGWWLWVATVATFVMPVSYDYDLIYFPVLLVLLYSKELPVWIRIIFYLQFLWWFPIGIWVSLKALMLVKLTGVLCAGWVLLRHRSLNRPNLSLPVRIERRLG